MPQQAAVDFDALAAQHGGAPVAGGVDYDALAADHGGSVATFSTSNEKDASGNATIDPASVLGAVKHLVTGYAEGINPWPALKAIYEHTDPIEAAGNPIGAYGKTALKGMAATHLELLKKGRDAFKDGRLSEALGYTLAAGIPLFGPAAADAGETIGRGDVMEGVGKGLADLTPLAGRYGAEVAKTGSLVPNAARVRLADMIAAQKAPAAASVARGVLANPNPEEAAAVAFGQQHGIPVDAGTASGNRAVKGVQFLADRSLGGSVIAEKARQAQGEGLATIGEQLAAKGHPQPVTPEQAGQGINDAVLGRLKDFDSQANTAYTTLRQIEAANPAAMTVNVAKARAGFKPLYMQLKREAELVPLMGDKARALTALDRLMTGPDAGPLSVVDGALGDLKAMARSDIPELRTQGQGTAAFAVQQLDREVRAAAARGGPQALDALETGRKATTAKYAVADVYDAIKDEPVKAFSQAVAPKDSAIAQLRDVAKYAPDELPKIGRAWMEQWLQHATNEGGFKGADKLFAEWQRLGPETKRLLFQDPALVGDLDKFFLLAKKLGENVNPSGTGHVVSLGAQTMTLFTEPLTGASIQIGAAGLAKLLRSPRAVKLLTQGLTMPRINKVGAKLLGTQLATLATEAGAGVPATATADRADQPVPTAQR